MKCFSFTNSVDCDQKVNASESKHKMNSSPKHNEQDHVDEGSVYSMKMNQTNLDFLDGPV